MPGATVGVTVVYTDLVGSTALTTSVSAAEAERIRQAHFSALGQAIEAHGGRVVKNLGDGVMAVFPGASAALDGAVAMQQRVVRHNQEDPGPPLSMRVAVSTGDCVEEAGDYFGEPVIQAARLCAACEGDEILVASVIGLLVPRDAYQLEPIGDLQLKGIPEPFPTLRLAWVPASGGADHAVPLPSRLSVQTGLSALVGRSSERETLAAAIKAAHAGERRLVLITGEAGMGKTRLTAEFAVDAFDRGTTVLYGRCDEELAVPYLPWVESLTHLVEHLADDAIAELPAAVRAQLARLLPSLHERDPGGGPAADEPTGAGDQYALFSAVSALLGAVTSAQTVLVVLDDLHWADRSTLQLLQHVAVTLPRSRLLIVGTYRETDLGADDPLTETSARLHRVEGVDRIALQGLSDAEIVQLLAGAAGHDLDDDAVALGHALRVDTAGNPFFVVEVIRHLVETGSIAQAEGRWAMAKDLADIALPQSVRDVVGQRVRRLGAPDATPVLTAAAVIGREFDTAVVAGAADLHEDRVLDVLEEAMAAGLVAEVAGAVDRFAFTHALVQHTLYGELSESRRARMHRRVATSLEALADPEPGELAKHWFAAVRPAELERAIDLAIEAGDRALASSAPDEGVRWYQQAFEALGDGDPVRRCEVQVRLGDAERQAGRESYRERLLDAATQAGLLGRGDLIIEAALVNYRGWHSAVGEIDHDRVSVLETALRQAEATGANRARLLATLAGELTYSDDARRFDMVSEAEDLAQASGDPLVVLDVLERAAGAISVPEMLPDRTSRVAQMVQLTEGGDDPVRRFLALDMQANVHLAQSDMAAARRVAAERRTVADGLGQTTFLWLATNHEALLDLLEGDVDAAAAGADRAFALGSEAGQPDVLSYYGAMVMMIHMHRHQHAEIVPLIRERAEAVPGASAFRATLANFLASAGETDEAASIIADMTTGGFAFDRDIVWLTSMALMTEAAVLVGDLDAARLLYEHLAPYADQTVTSRAHCIGPTSYYLGLVALATGEQQVAEVHFREALRAATGLRSPFYRARSLLGIAEAVRATDPSESTRLLHEVVDVADPHGLPGPVLRARELLDT